MNKNNWLMGILWLGIGIFGRLIPHLPNATPLCTLCLLAPTAFSKQFSLPLTITILIVSDFFCHLIFNTPSFGSWTFFTYTGWLTITFFSYSTNVQTTLIRRIIQTTIASLMFWIWTNFGTWCFSQGLYPHTMTGVLSCYIAAIPFLNSSIIGNCLWTIVLCTAIETRLRQDVIHRYIPRFWQ